MTILSRTRALRTKRLAGVAMLGMTLVTRPDGIAAQNETYARYALKGMVLKVAPSRRTFVVSHDSIPSIMDAMTMSLDVKEPKDLEGVTPGTTVEFTLVLGKESITAEHLRIRPYESVEQDPLTAQRLKQLREVLNAPSATGKALVVGQAVPDFALTDQARRVVRLSALRGKVVAVNFIYTSCVLPQFCFRIANNFAVVARRFKERVGPDLVLLTVTFDPARDHPEQLAEYAKQWQVNPDTWHFLTGSVPDIKRVCSLFGVDFFPDEGLMNHSSHTALIDRQGRLVANIEGNQFSARQLGDLVDTTLKQ